MAARTVRGLSSTDLDRVRRSLAAGRKPKVVFTESAGQLAGQLGQVVELTDPAASEEWIVVRFGHDTLSFAPTDLATPPKPATAPATPPKPARAARREPAAAAVAVRATPPPAQPPAGPPGGREQLDPAPPAKAVAPDPAADPAPRSAAAKAPARKAARAKAPAALAVTIAYADGAWTVAVQQGSRPLARPAQIRAGQALKLIEQLALPEVQAAADEIVTADRVAAERDADRLRAELAEIEARLADLDT
jgi:hypothetical protein